MDLGGGDVGVAADEALLNVAKAVLAIQLLPNVAPQLVEDAHLSCGGRNDDDAVIYLPPDKFGGAARPLLFVNIHVVTRYSLLVIGLLVTRNNQ